MGWRLLNSLTSSRSSYPFNYEFIFKRIYTWCNPLANLFICASDYILFSDILVCFPKSRLEVFSWCLFQLRLHMVLNVSLCCFRFFICHHFCTLMYYVPWMLLLEVAWIYLQGVDHFKKIQYADGITYGELFLENELVN